MGIGVGEITTFDQYLPLKIETRVLFNGLKEVFNFTHQYCSTMESIYIYGSWKIDDHKIDRLSAVL